jgi:phosphate/phosphite/phosphonate ABC transporter binding protein
VRDVEAYGKFELLTCLARGGMAEVFLARQRGEGRFERLVVIKRILPQFADDPRFVELFLEEARIAALLDHPNVIPIYDLGRVDDTYFIAMPFIHGLTVQVMLKEATRLRLALPFGISCEIARQALAGLSYAHERTGLDGQPMHLVHRDVTPANLMINDQGRVMVLDFGIASVADSASEETGSLRGKLAYMSPEQVRSDPLDRRSDLFSLGIVLYELLVGKRLFQRRSDPEVIDAITRQPLPDPRQERPDLPEALANLLRRALAREREQRFATALEMGVALERAVGTVAPAVGQRELGRFLRTRFGELLAQQERRFRQARDGEDRAESPTRVEVPRSARRPRRRRRWALAAVLLGLTLAAGGTASWLALRGPRLEGPPLRIGVVPFLPEEVLRREWEPLLEYLERRLHRPVQLVVTHSYGQIVEALLAGKVDVADLSAYPYLLARRRDPQLQLLATGVTETETTYECHLVVRRRSALRKLQDLADHRICYVDRTSTSGYLMPRVMVRKAGQDPDRFFASHQFSGDHYRALQDLLAGRCDVASVASGSYRSAERQGIPVQQLRILRTSAPMPFGVYCASSKVPRAVARRLRRALLGLDAQREFGRRRISDHLLLTGFASVDRRAFDDLEHEAERVLSSPAAEPPADSGPAPDAGR